MNSFTQSGRSSAVPSISDLDGYTIQDYNFPANSSYLPADEDQFGFDPPEEKTLYPKIDQTFSPQESTDSPLGGWPGFERDDERKEKADPGQTYHLDKLISQSLPNTNTAIARYGQVTPPRTNSSGSVQSVKQEENLSHQTTGSRRKSKQVKEPAPPAQTTTGRKRKSSRKATANAESTNAPVDAKRRASLEKNRLAAAKCRINKKEKTEQLQRDSHEKAVHNAYLKSEVLRMKDEVQQLNAILLAHASCEGCKSPEEIQKHLQELSAEYPLHQMNIGATTFADYPDMPLDALPPVGQEPIAQDSYFGMAPPDDSMLNPPLPEFDRSADFEVHTPMQTD